MVRFVVAEEQLLEGRLPALESDHIGAGQLRD
jgi:hypothetical protein